MSAAQTPAEREMADLIVSALNIEHVTADKIAFIGNAGVTEAGFSSTVINFTDLTAGSLSTGDYLLFDGDSNTNYSGLTLGGAFAGASVSGTAAPLPRSSRHSSSALPS